MIYICTYSGHIYVIHVCICYANGVERIFYIYKRSGTLYESL